MRQKLKLSGAPDRSPRAAEAELTRLAVFWLLGFGVVFVAPVISAAVSLTLLAVTYYVAFKRSPVAVIATLPIIALRVMELVAGVSLDIGVPLPEVGVTSEPSLSFFFLALLYACWPICLMYFPGLKGRQRLTVPFAHMPQFDLFLLILICYGLAILYFFAVNGFPIFMGVSKYDYYAQISNPIFSFLIRYQLIALFGLGYLLGVGRRPKIVLCTTLFFFALAILGSDKITSPVLMITSTLSMCYLIRPTKELFNWKTAAAVGVFLTVIFGGYFYSRFSPTGSASAALESVSSRFPAQGQMWYITTHNQPKFVGYDDEQLSQELLSIAPGGDSVDRTLRLGQSYMSRKYATPEAKLKFGESNLSFIMILYGYILDSYGMLAIFIANFVFIGYIGLVLNRMFYLMERGSIFSFIMFAAVYNAFVRTIISGNLSTMLGTIVYIFIVLSLLASLVFEFVARHQRKSGKPVASRRIALRTVAK